MKCTENRQKITLDRGIDRDIDRKIGQRNRDICFRERYRQKNVPK